MRKETERIGQNSIVQGPVSHFRNLYFIIVNEKSLQNIKKGWEVKLSVA